jgi:hypothetical protein
LRYYSRQVLHIVQRLLTLGPIERHNYMVDETLKSLKLAAYQLDYLADSFEYND